jgi:Domain of unknown function (DUF4783)
VRRVPTYCGWLIGCLLLTAYGSDPARAQVPEDLIESVRAAVDAGDAEALSDLGGERLEVGLFGAARLYSRSQATHVLGEFFRQFPPARLSIREAVSTEYAWFAASDYHRVEGREPYRVYLRIRRDGDRWVLREFVVLRAEGS